MKRNFRFMIIGILAVLVIFVSAWIAYSELTRPSTPVITINSNMVSWPATGEGDMRAGRFIRSYEVRVVIGSETLIINVDGPTEINEVMIID